MVNEVLTSLTERYWGLPRAAKARSVTERR
jgi:hypothetical protein